MSLEVGFLHDICTNPQDITPRLVYADWLDERNAKDDAARAEFIRIQCRLHGKEPLAAAEAMRLDTRQHELLSQWKATWAKPFQEQFANYDYRRGFIERATLKAKTFLHIGEAILSRTPLRLAKLRDPDEYIEALADCRTVERLWGLNLNNGKLGAARVLRLLASPLLNRLHWLDLGNNNIGQAGAAHLVRASAGLASLRYLALDDNKLGDHGLEHLTASPFLGQIEALNLDGNRLTIAGIRKLADSRYAGRLAQLHVGRNYDLGLEGIEALLASPNLPSLRWMHFDGFTALAEAVKRLQSKYGCRVKLDTDGVLVNMEYGPVAKL